jgi:hypothetical protein
MGSRPSVDATRLRLAGTGKPGSTVAPSMAGIIRERPGGGEAELEGRLDLRGPCRRGSPGVLGTAVEQALAAIDPVTSWPCPVDYMLTSR